MTCDDVQTRLTAYLDGDLDADRGTVIRGHLRTCDGCRKVAAQEAALRDGLRALPTVDPPPAMWAGIQAQLAAAEVAESQRPAWRRALARWTPMLPRLAMGGVLAVAAAGVLWWRAHRPDDLSPTRLVDQPSPSIKAASHDAVAAAPSHAPMATTCNLDAPPGTDVADDLASEPARVTGCYAQISSELTQLATEARAGWTDTQRAEFDARVVELRRAVDTAEGETGRQRALRKLNRYLKDAVTRDQVALASGAP